MDKLDRLRNALDEETPLAVQTLHESLELLGSMEASGNYMAMASFVESIPEVAQRLALYDTVSRVLREGAEGELSEELILAQVMDQLSMASLRSKNTGIARILGLIAH